MKTTLGSALLDQKTKQAQSIQRENNFLALLLNECLDSGALFGSKDLHNVRDLRYLSILCLFSFPNYGLW
ncbi:hypothetical protein Q3G72_011342 [Acer saccharum]|nr:hypothetical protein Q3G72_011342 [Acer saccharum]